MSLDFVAEMGWKSAVVSAAALFILALLRSRSAVDRAAVLRLGVLLLLLLPLISIMLPSLQVEEPRVEPLQVGEQASRPVFVALPTDRQGAAPQAPSPATPPDRGWTDAAPVPESIPGERLLMLGYLAGALLVAARLLAGLWVLRRWTRGAEEVSSLVWRSALRRARAAAKVSFNVRLLVSDQAPAPMSWGLREPVILIDAKSFARSEDADAILAHEMAHIARKDWLMLMLSRLAVALFWFNPLVWLLERMMVQQAEEAADLHAVRRLEPTSYAMTLVTCFCQTDGAVIAANSIAAGRGLTRRIAAILDDEQRGTPSGSLWTVAAMVACVAVAAPTAALEFVPASNAEALPHAQAAPRATMSIVAAPAADVVAPVAQAAVIPVAPQVEIVVPDEPIPAPMPSAAPQTRIVALDEAKLAGRVEKAAAAAVKAAAAATRAAAVIDVDTLVAMKINGVDAAYLSELAAISPRYRGLSPDELIAMRIHGISPAKLRQFADLGYGNVTQDELIGMTVQGVTPAFIREMASAGYRDLTPEQLIAMRIHGVDADAARRANSSKRRLSPDELIEKTILGEL